ncbi:voltage-gated sodium channel [Caldalkalibacillus uzonensis]|uniref:Voltage-gated sodium channel n=1 Tax=Caldalkalibacillus uzonensis TaxID=353224 RepID=A0ABU0CV14_9BACI|nr:voltage-gated sodium channel [Caldalkalibacillus uzonensis]
MSQQRHSNMKYRLETWCDWFVHHPRFTSAIVVLIVINAIVIGMETYPGIYKPYRDWFYLIDRIILWVFTVEIILKLVAIRPRYQFFKDSWNVFDFLIVASGHLFVGAQFVTVLRVLRVLRLLRAVTVIPSLRKLVSALLYTIPALGNIMLLMGLIFYIFAVIGTFLFRDVAPEYFGSLHLSLITLFQVVTLESWASGVMRPIMAEVFWSWIYFVTFILVGTFVIFNLFVGVIVSNVERAETEEAEEEQQPHQRVSADHSVSDEEIKQLRNEIKELRQLLRDLKNHQSHSSS